jgi:hypothetical protein
MVLSGKFMLLNDGLLEAILSRGCILRVWQTCTMPVSHRCVWRKAGIFSDESDGGNEPR